MEKSIVAAVQMMSGDDVQDNLLQAEKLIYEAVYKGAKLVVLPENFYLMTSNEENKLKLIEKFGSGPLQDFLSQQAKKHKIYLAGGTIPIESKIKNKFYSSCLLYDYKGKLITRYDKTHLFDVVLNYDNKENVRKEVYNESNYVEAGNDIKVVNTDIGKIGIAICYDLRFPELFRKMLAENVEIIIIPSAFTVKTGMAHWSVLLRARAVENLAYVIAAAQAGRYNSGRETYGHSMIIEPWGGIIAQQPQGIGAICADLVPERQKLIRDNFPCIKHRHFI